MTARLTAERESDIRLAVAYADDPLAEPQRSLGWLLAELDAVRAERDEAVSKVARQALTIHDRQVSWHEMRERLDRAEATLATIREAAFRAGYHCRWHKTQGHYCFDPLMSPGDPDGAYVAWLALLDAAPKDSADGPGVGGPVTGPP